MTYQMTDTHKKEQGVQRWKGSYSTRGGQSRLRGKGIELRLVLNDRMFPRVVGSPAIHSFPEPETRGEWNNPLSPVYSLSLLLSVIYQESSLFLLNYPYNCLLLPHNWPQSGFCLPITWIIVIASCFSCLHIQHCCQEFLLNDLSDCLSPYFFPPLGRSLSSSSQALLIPSVSCLSPVTQFVEPAVPLYLLLPLPKNAPSLPLLTPLSASL